MGYQLPHYPDRDLYEPGTPEHLEAGDRWTAQDYTLCAAFGLSDNHQVDDLLWSKLVEAGLDGPAVEFDSEAGCFFAHTHSAAEMVEFVAFVADAVAAGPHPDATPGNIVDSPAYIGPGRR